MMIARDIATRSGTYLVLIAAGALAVYWIANKAAGAAGELAGAAKQAAADLVNDVLSGTETTARAAPAYPVVFTAPIVLGRAVRENIINGVSDWWDRATGEPTISDEDAATYREPQYNRESRVR
jgi:hypothetical protein